MKRILGLVPSKEEYFRTHWKRALGVFLSNEGDFRTFSLKWRGFLGLFLSNEEDFRTVPLK